MTDLTFKIGSFQDKEVLHLLRRRLRQETDFLIYSEREQARDAEALRTGRMPNRSFVILMMKNGKTIGFLRFERTGADCGYLIMGVDKNYQNLGFGTQLLNELKRHATARAIRQLYLYVAPENSLALALYQCHAFVIENEEAVQSANDHYRMVLTLPLD